MSQKASASIPRTDAPTVAILGGGAAGLAAAVAAVEQGFHTTLFEAAPRLGGRASSYCEPTTDQRVDLCQHVAMGCCTNFLDLCRKTGTAHLLKRHRQLHFFGPDGRRRDFAATRWLPAPLHLLPALWGLDYLTRGERLGVIRSLGRLARLAQRPTLTKNTLGSWLREEGQTAQVIERFWSVVVESALSVKVHAASLFAARKVFVDGFLASSEAYELLVPTVSLGELWDTMGRSLEEHGATVQRRTAVRWVEGRGDTGLSVVLADGSQSPFDFVVSAVNWRQVCSILPPAMLSRLPELAGTQQIQSSPITSVHLWFDRPITELPHAAVVGRTAQWVFCPQTSKRIGEQDAHYVQVVISASQALAHQTPKAIADAICAELAELFPAAKTARLLHHRVITHRHAVFSVLPGIEALRPSQQSSLPNLLLAGDWTATDWPATMEGAVRSGYLAVEAILRSTGKAAPVVAADLPHARLTRWLLPQGDRTGSGTTNEHN